MGAVPYPDGGQRDASDFLRSVLELASPPGTNLADTVPLDTGPPGAATDGTSRLTCRTSQTLAGQLLLTEGTCSGDWDLWQTMRITMAPPR